MNIALCEDSAQDMAVQKKLLDQALARTGLDMKVDYYKSGEALLRALDYGRSYSLYILDIYMLELNGIQTARKIRDIDPEAQFAFLTTSRDHTLSAFDLNALHYLIKPVTAEALIDCLERFRDRARIPSSVLEIKSEFKTYTFPQARVLKILSANKGIDVYLFNSDTPSHIPISFIKAEEQLDSNIFLMVSRGFIVQMSYILRIDNDLCTLKDGSSVLISRREKSEIRKKYNDFLFQR